MSGILAIFKKELARFFGDKRMAFTAIVLPGLLLYTVYSLMGTFMADNMSTDETVTPVVAVTEVPASLSATLEQIFILTPVTDQQEAQELVTQGHAHAAVLFPQDFDLLVATYHTGMGDAPMVELYFDTADPNSYATYETLAAILDSYESALSNKFDVAETDTATEEDTFGQFLASMLPMLMMTMLYSGCTSAATEAIAGEKERGTIATLLITPVGRSQIAIGKILALSLISLLSGVSSILGIVLSLPKILGSDISAISIYGPREYLMLAVVTLSTVLLMVTVISVISTFAKTVREASTMTSPLMVISMLMGVLGMAGLGSSDHNALYLIPLYNTSQVLSGILSFADVTVPVVITALSNLVYSLAGIWLLTKLFHNEKILFNN